MLSVNRYLPKEVKSVLAAKVNCSTFLYDSDEYAEQRSQFDVDRAVHIVLPQWQSWLAVAESSAAIEYPPHKNWVDTLDDTVAIFHTSGTTGKKHEPISVALESLND